jgi:phage protein D
MAKTSDTAETQANLEKQLVAFAEQLGRIVGTVQAKAEGWMDREALNKQIAGVRDGAAALLEQLSDGVTSLTKTATRSAKAAGSAAAAAKSQGRSGGVVDAPGKKHRKPMPKDPRAMAADAKSANMRAGKASMKTTKTRGRG